jgi:hypothetical protein
MQYSPADSVRGELVITPVAGLLLVSNTNTVKHNGRAFVVAFRAAPSTASSSLCVAP